MRATACKSAYTAKPTSFGTVRLYHYNWAATEELPLKMTNFTQYYRLFMKGLAIFTAHASYLNRHVKKGKIHNVRRLQRTSEARSRTHCCRGKAINITYSKSVFVALVIQQLSSACAVLYCPLWSVCLYHIFPHYLIKACFSEQKLLNIKCVFWFSLQL
jgi:hypothetical protein